MSCPERERAQSSALDSGRCAALNCGSSLGRLPRVLRGRVVEASEARAKDEDVVRRASEARAGLM